MDTPERGERSTEAVVGCLALLFILSVIGNVVLGAAVIYMGATR